MLSITVMGPLVHCRVFFLVRWESNSPLAAHEPRMLTTRPLAPARVGGRYNQILLLPHLWACHFQNGGRVSSCSWCSLLTKQKQPIFGLLRGVLPSPHLLVSIYLVVTQNGSCTEVCGSLSASGVLGPA